MLESLEYDFPSDPILAMVKTIMDNLPERFAEYADPSEVPPSELAAYFVDELRSSGIVPDDYMEEIAQKLEESEDVRNMTLKLFG